MQASSNDYADSLKRARMNTFLYPVSKKNVRDVLIQELKIIGTVGLRVSKKQMTLILQLQNLRP